MCTVNVCNGYQIFIKMFSHDTESVKNLGSKSRKPNKFFKL